MSGTAYDTSGEDVLASWDFHNVEVIAPFYISFIFMYVFWIKAMHAHQTHYILSKINVKLWLALGYCWLIQTILNAINVVAQSKYFLDTICDTTNYSFADDADFSKCGQIFYYFFYFFYFFFFFGQTVLYRYVLTNNPRKFAICWQKKTKSQQTYTHTHTHKQTNTNKKQNIDYEWTISSIYLVSCFRVC